MYSTRALKVENISIRITDNISSESTFRWLSDDIVRFKIEVGVSEKCTKM